MTDYQIEVTRISTENLRDALVEISRIIREHDLVEIITQDWIERGEPNSLADAFILRELTREENYAA